MTIQNLGERLLKIICHCTTHTGEINGLPVKCNSLIRKVVVETGVCRDVGTTVSAFFVAWSASVPFRPFHFRVIEH